MERAYYERYSGGLGRNVTVQSWGSGGRPILYVPCQDGHAGDFEGFRMSEVLAPWIEAGRCRVFSIDTADAESWSDRNGDPYWRIRRHETWIEWITRELVPFIREQCGLPARREGGPGVMSFGCSLGASHALNLYLRFPDLFDRCLALSGMYHASFFFGDYMDEVVYANSPADYLTNMAPDHPFLAQYRRNRAVVCTGQGAWEEPWSPRALDRRFRELGIPVWVDYWGWDVNHDWPWWYRQAAYFLPYLLDERTDE